MHCPNDNTLLVMTERQGVEIDYCPQCRGVWLDRGELDKIIERGQGAGTSQHGFAPQPGHHQQPSHRPTQQRHYDDDDDDHHRDYRTYGHDSDEHHRRKHKKEGFLGDLFDF
ncbi:zf-TFIIB domain-containing protein [Candidatus Saccharibacteria bacterium]|nr:zf-TFIIB domain-containing protein [Candidatus Saccharibacteria bacterium]